MAVANLELLDEHGLLLRVFLALPTLLGLGCCWLDLELKEGSVGHIWLLHPKLGPLCRKLIWLVFNNELCTTKHLLSKFRDLCFESQVLLI